MARLFKNIPVYAGRWDITGKSNEVALDYSVDEKDATVLDSDTSLSFPGLMKVSASIKGLMDLGTLANGAVEQIIFDRVSSETSIPFGFGAGPADGDSAFFFGGLVFSGNPLSGSPGDLHPFDMKVGNAPASQERLVSGRIALPKAVYSGATGSGTAYQLGALSTTQKLYAALHMFATDGSIDVTIESDDTGGFGTPTTQVTFTTATGATEELLSAAGAITDDWWRVSYTRTGGTDFTAAVLFGIGPA